MNRQASQSLVSILMPVFNTGRYVGKAIESILGQTYQNYELLVIDDGSTDRSASIVEQYAKDEKKIQLIRQENKGIVATRNRLLELARGDYFAIMDSDDICHPSRIEEQYRFLAKNPDYLIVGCRDLLIDQTGSPIMEINHLFEHEEIDRANLSLGTFQTLNAYMASTASVRNVGGYRANVVYAEDRDLFLRLAEIGKVKVLDKVLYQYRQHVGSTCYQKPGKIDENVLKVIRDAKVRRGLEMAQNEHRNQSGMNEPISTKRIYSAWAWQSLQGGYPKTSFKYALKLFLLNPADKQWLSLIISITKYLMNSREPRVAPPFDTAG